MTEIFSIFESVFIFLYDIYSIPVLGDYSVLDVLAFGVISGAVARFIILPIFGKFGSFSSSSAERPQDRNQTVIYEIHVKDRFHRKK